MKKVKVTRRSIFGFGYTTACVRTENGLRLCEVDKPDFVGTIRQVMDFIHNDRAYNVEKSSGAYLGTAFFVKANGKLIKLTSDQFGEIMQDLLIERVRDCEVIIG